MGIINDFIKIVNFNTCEYLIENKNFIINYSPKLGRPVWAAYSLNKKTLQNVKGGRKKFMLDVELVSKQIYQLEPNSRIFSNQWSRGHLIPSFLMSWDKTKNGPWSSTYKMSNIIPQNKSFNTNNWNKIEQDTYHFIKNKNTITKVITGCCNLDTDKKIKFSSGSKIISSNVPSNPIWVDEKSEFEYQIPSIMYQLVITPWEVFCYVGQNNQEQKIEKVRLNILEQIIGINFNL